MSLRVDDVGPSLLGASAAVAVRGRVAVGLNSGELRVYDGQTLERVLNVGRSVTALAHIPDSDLLAVIVDRHCVVHNLATRKIVCEVDTKSAKGLAATKDVLLVASAYKLRILTFKHGQLGKTTVIDSPGGQKVRCVGAGADAYCVLGKVLWRLDFVSSTLRPLLALDLPKNAHHFVLTATQNSLFIGCSSGGQLIRLDPLKVIGSWPDPFTMASTLISEPLNLPLIVVQASKTLLINPTTATVLDEALDITLFGNYGLRSSKLVQVSAHLSVDDIVALENPSEAASLALHLDSTCVTEDLRAIERSEAAKLFEAGDIDDAIRLFLQVEEQDDSFQTHPFVASLLGPYLASLAQQEPSPPDRVPSVFTTKTARTAPKHYLDPIVTYLVFTRRKLRLARADTPQEATTELDTALLRCYMIMGSPLVVPLLRSPNMCDPEVVRELLLGKGKWRELVWFLRSRGLYKEALDLLVEHNDPPESIVSLLESLPGPLSSSRLDLTFEYARQPLTQNHKLAHRLFFEEHNVESSAVFAFLSEIDAKLGQAFAEFRVTQFGDQTPALHNAVARFWAKDESNHPKLLDFLKSSQSIDLAELSAAPEIPKRGLAILYERQNQHQKAVDTLLNDCGDLQQALIVAERNNVSTYLFQKLVNNSASPEGLSLLLEYLASASPSADLELSHSLTKLPSSIKLESVTRFLQTFMADASAKEKSSALGESVNRLALTELSVQITEYRKQKFIVGPTDACCVCHKRLGKAVTGVVDGSLAHYACLKLL